MPPLPPAVVINISEAIEIAALPEVVWRVVTSDEAIGLSPGMLGSPGWHIRYAGNCLGRASERDGWAISRPVLPRSR